jgi:hypothetical protein
MPRVRIGAGIDTGKIPRLRAAMIRGRAVPVFIAKQPAASARENERHMGVRHERNGSQPGPDVD